MRRFLFVAGIVGLVLTPTASWARKNAGDQGYGLMLGNPSGLSGKFWFSDRVALDGAFGIARGEVDAHLSFLYHDFDTFQRMGIRTPANTDTALYFGLGPRILFEDDEEFGIRIPVGVTFFPHRTAWEIFAEIAPVIRLTPDSGFNGDFAIGARYYFDAIRPRQ